MIVKFDTPNARAAKMATYLGAQSANEAKALLEEYGKQHYQELAAVAAKQEVVDAGSTTIQTAKNDVTITE